MQVVAEVERILVAAELAQEQLVVEMVAVVRQEHVVRIPITPEVRVLLVPMDSVGAAVVVRFIQVEQPPRSAAMVDLVS
jgi:hypothetical protein